jgi:enamine deaminase RidA (YjgF/YER057c/UK114 family)
MDNVIKTVLMLKRLEDYPEMRKTIREYYQKYAPHLLVNPPVSSFMQLPEISSVDALFQIDITAVLPDNNLSVP